MKDTDETDPLALIVAALRAATDAANEATVAAKAAHMATAETKNAINDLNDSLIKKVNAIGKALNNMTISRQAIGQAKSDRYLWAFVGFMAGIPAGVAIVSYLPPVWQRLVG